MIKAIFYITIGVLLYKYVDWQYTAEFVGTILVELAK
tara:strand:+ start:251 stop:361 length:111 start_codon:yes stop_codon:yes gene_type:complete